MVLLERPAGRPHDPGLVLSASYFFRGLSARPSTTAGFEEGGIRERRGEKKTQTTYTHLRKDPGLLGVPSPPERCSHELLQGGHGEKKSRGFRDTETQGARSAPCREQPRHEMTSPAGELAPPNKQSPNCRLLHINAAQQPCGPGQVGERRTRPESHHS